MSVDIRIPVAVEKEPDHLTRGVRAFRVGIGPVWAAAGPCVTGTTDLPVLHERNPSAVRGHAPDIVTTAGRTCFCFSAAVELRSKCRGNNPFAIRGMHRLIGIAMKYDRANAPAWLGCKVMHSRQRWVQDGFAAHRGKGRDHISRRAMRQTGMDPDC